jgi:hypothetical protein
MIVVALVLVLLAAVCAYLVFHAPGWLNPLTAGVLALVLLLCSGILGARWFANRRKVSVVISTAQIAAGGAIDTKTVATVKVSRDHAQGYLRDATEAVGRFAAHALEKDEKLKAADVRGVAVGHRAFAIVVDDQVTLSDTFSAGDLVDLNFAAAKDVRPAVVPSVTVVALNESPAELVVSLDEAETRRVLKALGRTRLVVTKAIS